MQRFRPSGSSRRAGLALAALLLLAACGERGGGPVESAAPLTEPAQPAHLSQIACTADVRAGTVSCAQPTAAGDPRAVVVGGNDQQVKLVSSPATYSAADGTLTFEVTLENRLLLALGTADGATPSADGVQVFFESAPKATSGKGTITVAGDGVAEFTAPGQPYYRYAGAELGPDGILSAGETSAPRAWTLRVPETVQTFSFRVLVSAAVQNPHGWIDVTPEGARVEAGGTRQLTAVVRTVVGVAVPTPVAWTTSDPAVATVDGSGNVTGVAPGDVTITATSGPRTGSATLRVCPNLAVGGAYTFGPAEAAGLCIGGGAAGAEYTLMPANLSTGSSMTITATATSAIPVAGPPSPSLSPFGGGPRLSTTAGGLEPNDAWEQALRQRERRELEPLGASGLIAGRSASGARFFVTPGVPALGDTMILNSRSNSACGTPTLKTAVVKAIGAHVIIVADTGNPTVGGFTDADYTYLAAQFDTFIHPTVTAVTGTPADIDQNGRVIAFYTEAVNQLSPPNSGSFVGGFVFARDLFSNASCPGSNQGEMFYMLAPDSLGENGNQFTASFVRRQTEGTLSHEYQHLINASRRMYVNTPWNGTFEATWLDEGLAHAMEELLFYRAAGMSPRNNVTLFGTGDGGLTGSKRIGAWNTYSNQNFARLRSFLARPDTTGPFQNDTDLSTRGAIWAFLRYAADRKGGDEQQTWFSLVNATSSGLTNLQNVLGTDPRPWFRDWVAAMYGDDAVAGVGAQHQNQSWNFRSFYQGAGTLGAAYPLGTRNLGDGTETVLIRPGSAAVYLRFGVAAGGFSDLAITSANAAPFGLMQATLMRTK